MPIFEKDVLYPGEYRLADGRRVKYTREDVAHLKQRLKDMTAAGLSVPVSYEHQDDAKPQSEADRRGGGAKWNLGFVLDADETPEGYLVARLDVPSAADAARLPSVRFASPEIVDNYIDGSGKVWPGKSITHIAASPRPVQHHQQPFRDVTQMSGGVTVGAGQTAWTVNYSRADPNAPVWLSLVDRLAEGEGEGGKPSTDEDARTKESVPDEAQSEADAKFQALLECLRADGYGLPDDTTPENLLERLHTAALTKQKVLGDQYGGNDLGTPSNEGVSPVTMSLEQRLAAAEKRLLAQGREQLLLRIGTLFSTGRIGKPLRDKLLQEAGTVQLSLDESGALREVKLIGKVEAYEALPASFAGADRLGSGQGDGDGGITAVDHPEGMAGPPRTREEIDRVLADHFAETGSTTESR